MAVYLSRCPVLSFVLVLFKLCCGAVSLSEGHVLPDKMQQGPLMTEQHADQHVMTAPPGDDVTLRCEAGNVSISAVEWTRADLESEYVLLYRDGHFDPEQQHPSFRDRVELVDRELKDGDVSLILKNVSSRDSGTYECRVKSRRTKRAIIKTDPISIINLEVTDSKNEHFMDGHFPRGHVGLAAASGVVAVLLLAAAAFAVWRHKRHTDQRPELSAADEAGNNQLMCPSAV